MNHKQLEKIPNEILLNRLLSHSDFARFNEWGSDDWRDPNEKNPSLSLSSKGWYNHKTGAEGSLYDLAKKRDLLEVPQDPLNIQENRDQKGQSDTTKQAERLWKQEESQPAKERSQHYLSEQRKIPIENYKDLLGSHLRCVEDNQGREILLCPMLTPDQRNSAEAGSSFSAEKVHRVILLEGDRYEKKQLGSPSDGVGRISYLPPLSEDCESLQYLVIEGLEDALSIRSRYRDHHFLVCQSKGNLKYVPEFLTNGAEVLILSDHDGHANPNENGEYAAAELRQQLLRSGYECTALMPAEAGDDANKAFQESRLDQWFQNLVEVPSLPEERPLYDDGSEVFRTLQSYIGNFQKRSTKSGEVLIPNLNNVYELLKVAKAPIWFDAFRGKIQMRQGDETIEWKEHQTLKATRQIQSKHIGLEKISTKIMTQAVELYAKDNPRNELTDWLNSFQWDRIQRLDTWLIDYCGVEDSVYSREVGRCWLLGAVTRAFRPGTQFDQCLVLEGEQGIGKSSLLRTLANGWIQELEDFRGKDSAEVLMGTWICEISELSAMKKADIESVKRFLTAVSDRYRPAYGHWVEDFPRTCVFAGTTNRSEYLKDASGNRRFLPVVCQHIDREAFQRDRDQLLAETVHRFKDGESLLMSQEAIDLAKEEQEYRYEEDSWTGLIDDYVSREMSVTIDGIFGHLEIDARHRSKTNEIRVGRILTQELKWKKGKRKQVGGVRNFVYYPPDEPQVVNANT